MKAPNNMLQITVGGVVIEEGSNANGRYRIFDSGWIDQYDPTERTLSPGAVVDIFYPVAYSQLPLAYTQDTTRADALLPVSLAEKSALNKFRASNSGGGSNKKYNWSSHGQGTASTRAHLFNPNATYDRYIDIDTLAMKFSNPLVPDHLYIDPVAIPAGYVNATDYPHATTPASEGNIWVWNAIAEDFEEQGIVFSNIDTTLPTIEALIDGGTF